MFIIAQMSPSSELHVDTAPTSSSCQKIVDYHLFYQSYSEHHYVTH